MRLVPKFHQFRYVIGYSTYFISYVETLPFFRQNIFLCLKSIEKRALTRDELYADSWALEIRYTHKYLTARHWFTKEVPGILSSKTRHCFASLLSACFWPGPISWIMFTKYKIRQFSLAIYASTQLQADHTI